MSDTQNVDIMLGSYSRNDEEVGHSESELNLNSGSRRPQKNSNETGEDFRSLLTNSRDNSEITIETSRMNNEEISNQLTRRFSEIKSSLNFQIQSAISAAITETVVPSIQNTLDMQGRTNFTVVDRGSNEPYPGIRTANSTAEDQRSSELQRNPEAGNVQKTWVKRSKTVPMQEHCRHRSREISVDSYNNEQNRDSAFSL